MKLAVESANLSKSGKTYNVKVGDKYYLAKKDSNITTAVGKTIEAEVTESEYNGATLLWINEWALVSNGSAEPATTQPKASGNAPWFAPFVSNICAHAIQAGLIKTPEELAAWAGAAADAAVKADSDSIPF